MALEGIRLRRGGIQNKREEHPRPSFEERLENDEVIIFRKDPERQEENKYISETSEAKEEMISRRRELSPLPKMSKASSKLRTESVHEIYRLNSYGRVMRAEGSLGGSWLRGGWMGRKQSKYRKF